MTIDFENLIHLYYCAIYDKTPDVRDYNFDNILTLAKKHEILQSVFLSVKKLFNEGIVNINKDAFNSFNTQIMSDVALNIRRKQGLYEAIDELEQNGIKCCLLKGDAVGRLYASPHMRISSDIDILIDTEDEENAIRILKELEFNIVERQKTSHHFEAFSFDNAMLEVHIKLYSDTTKDLVFDGEINYSKDYMQIELPNGETVNTLNINDTAFFLTAHFLKHFIASGVGLRQISDMLVFLNEYKDEIDFENYFKTFEKLKYLKLICAVLKLGNDYFDLNFDIPYEISDEIYQKFLSYIEVSGVFGNGEKGAARFIDYFVSQRAGNRFTKKYKKSMFKRIFPDLFVMKRMYPSLEKFPFLLPVTYVIRAFKVIFKIKEKRQINDENIVIFKDFDII